MKEPVENRAEDEVERARGTNEGSIFTPIGLPLLRCSFNVDMGEMDFISWSQLGV